MPAEEKDIPLTLLQEWGLSTMRQLNEAAEDSADMNRWYEPDKIGE